MANQQQQQPGSGLTDQQQAALVQIGKMMGPQTDEFDQEVQRLHNKRHQAEHDATDYEQAFGSFPHEANYEKMRAAETGGSALGPSEADVQTAKQRQAIQQTTSGQSQVQAAQAQAKAQPPVPPKAPGGAAGVETPYPAQQGQGQD